MHACIQARTAEMKECIMKQAQFFACIMLTDYSILTYWLTKAYSHHPTKIYDYHLNTYKWEMKNYLLKFPMSSEFLIFIISQTKMSKVIVCAMLRWTFYTNISRKWTREREGRELKIIWMLKPKDAWHPHHCHLMLVHWAYCNNDMIMGSNNM